MRPSAAVQPLGGVRGRPRALRDASSAQGLEGVMAKRKGSRYAQGRRTRDWLKVKTHGRQEFVIAGYTRGTGSRASAFGSLVLAVNEGGELRYAGNVGTGFDEREIARLLALAETARATRVAVREPAEDAARSPRRRDVGRAAARGRGRVQRVDARRARAPAVLQGPPRGQGARPRCGTSGRRPTSIRAGKRELALSNLDKLFWPEEGITKGDLLEYYRAVAPVLVPHLKGRPFTMRRYPDGAFGKAFFQKDAPVAHAGLDPDLRDGGHDTVEGACAANGLVPGRRRRAGAALDGEHGLHRHEPVVLAGRQARPAGLRAVRPRSDARGAVRPDRRGRADPEGRCSTASASSRSRRRPAGRASTCSCRSTAGRPTRTPARSPSTSRA